MYYIREKGINYGAVTCRFSQTIGVVNGALQSFAAGASYASFLDCGGGFISEDGSAVDVELMPDALHPSAGGIHMQKHTCMYMPHRQIQRNHMGCSVLTCCTIASYPKLFN